MKYFTLISAKHLGSRKIMDWGMESSFSTTTFLISVAELYLCVPDLGKMIPLMARLDSRRRLGHIRLAVLLRGYQNHAQRCCFVQSPVSPWQA